jgi:predicted metal-dependent enzyme (double-stranded beta helix superfamily)
MNETDHRAERAAHVAATVGRIRSIAERGIARHGIDRAALEAIKAELLALAARDMLFSATAFPPPPGGTPGAHRYGLHVDADDRYALYLNAMNPGCETRPHDHTTWAVVVAVEGQELNRLYRRSDDETGLIVEREVMVEPGAGLALMPDDIHSIHIVGSRPTRHLHMYGLALERLTARHAFDPETGAALPFAAPPRG